jgi:hypothetical protein
VWYNSWAFVRRDTSDAAKQRTKESATKVGYFFSDLPSSLNPSSLTIFAIFASDHCDLQSCTSRINNICRSSEDTGAACAECAGRQWHELEKLGCSTSLVAGLCGTSESALRLVVMHDTESCQHKVTRTCSTGNMQDSGAECAECAAGMWKELEVLHCTTAAVAQVCYTTVLEMELVLKNSRQ